MDLIVLDASAKIPSGLIPTAYKTHMGNVMTHIGNFDECLAVAVAEDDFNFRGQYCRTTLELSTSAVRSYNVTCSELQ
jgi:Nose resistant-to-fluoxetine protein, N-terminal domain